MKRILSIIFLLSISLSHAYSQQKEVNEFIDNWHKAAAEADADIFFGSIAEDGI